MLKQKYCKSCGWLDSSQRVCKRTGIQQDPEKDFCSKHLSQENITTCDCCNNLVPSENIVIDTEFNNLLCPNCAKQLHSCSTCKFAQRCEFTQNPDPLPKVVMQTIQQGPAYIQTQVKNPERVEKFCKQCECFKDDTCLKEFSTGCNSYIYKNIIT